MSSTIAMDSEAEPAHSSYPYFNGSAGSASAALGSAGSSSTSSSPYNLSNRAYSADPTTAYNLYSQYYGYPYGMGSFSGTGSSSAGSGFSGKTDYSSYYSGTYPASWTGNPYR